MTILVTCSCCDSDNRVAPQDMIVCFSDSPDERAAELVFGCGTCGGTPVQRVPEELAAVVVFRGAASLSVSDLLPEGVGAAAQDAAGLRGDDLGETHLVETHLAPQDGERVRCSLDEQGLDDS